MELAEPVGKSGKGREGNGRGCDKRSILKILCTFRLLERLTTRNTSFLYYRLICRRHYNLWDSIEILGAHILIIFATETPPGN